MERHRTALTEGQLAEFLGAGVKALTLIANDLGSELAHNWANNGQAMQHAFISALAPLEREQKKKNPFLKLLSGGENLILDACDGKITIAQARNIFSWIDPDFKNWNTDNPGSATEKTPVIVYEMRKDATFSQMFGSFEQNLSNLCLEQDQILNFVQKYRNWLRKDGYATFFLFKANNNFFVAYVSVFSDGKLRVSVYGFEYSYVWDADYGRCLVVPQLAT